MNCKYTSWNDYNWWPKSVLFIASPKTCINAMCSNKSFFFSFYHRKNFAVYTRSIKKLDSLKKWRYPSRENSSNLSDYDNWSIALSHCQTTCSSSREKELIESQLIKANLKFKRRKNKICDVLRLEKKKLFSYTNDPHQKWRDRWWDTAHQLD